MNYSLLMQLADSIANLFYQASSFNLWNFLFFFHIFLELTPDCWFQNKINILSVMEKTIHLDDIGTLKKQLNFELSDKLFCHF